MKSLGAFPFGQLVRDVTQVDRTQKRVFILGVYSSAVHARWVGVDDKAIVQALAVASEPYIFWRGEKAEAIIERITIPAQLGKLFPASQQFNGPSGIALDDLILEPLRLSRADAWLCDLVPHSCMNPAQRQAIESKYIPVAEKNGLPMPTVPPVPTMLTDENRRKAILDELQESGARTLILLGDKPIQWFLAHFDPRWKRLADFGRDSQHYGALHVAQIDGRQMDVLPLAHPRQIARLGQSSATWYDEHQAWVSRYASKIIPS